MLSNSDSPPVSALLLTVVFQLGICILLLSEIADAARGYGTLIGLAGRLIGFVTVAAVLLTALVRYRTKTRG